MKKFFSFFISIAAVLILTVPALALAQDTKFTTGNGSGFTTGSGSGFTTGSGCGGSGGTFTLCNPLGFTNFCDLVKTLLNIVLAIGVPVAVLFLVWSGFRFILARGRPGDLEAARRNFYFVIIGIAVFLGAWTLATIISATVQTLDSSGAIQFCGR